MPGQDCGLRFAAFDQRSHKIDNQQPASGTDESREMWWSCSRRSTISFCKLTTSPVVSCGSRIRVSAISSCRRKLFELVLSTTPPPLLSRLPASFASAKQKPDLPLRPLVEP